MEKGLKWQPHFVHQEVWVLNTAYKLYGPWGPNVALKATHVGRMDELAKCLAVAPPNADVRLFWADAVVSVEGEDLSNWIRFLGKKAPSEQQIAKFLWPNIYAAWRGELSSRSLHEAKQDWSPDKPTPGVTVWKYNLEQEDDWPQQSESSRCWEEWPRGPTATGMSTYLQKLRDGVAAGKRANPLSKRADPDDPQVLITVLGGPKGITSGFKATVQAVFGSQGVAIVEASLGPHEQMAHACVAHLRLQDDAGLLRAAITDLLHLGRFRYKSLLRATEATLHRLWQRQSSKPLWRGRRVIMKLVRKQKQASKLSHRADTS
ncbi:unnamed protein product [Durusdinium trenchii]|uniref:Uncharacterized protein n=1 Tax=Durusdinium trenchii TaxID=1381693 RepID=A0ABP0RUP4_9DINO